jgi:hypothetical protein
VVLTTAAARRSLESRKYSYSALTPRQRYGKRTAGPERTGIRLWYRKVSLTTSTSKALPSCRFSMWPRMRKVALLGKAVPDPFRGRAVQQRTVQSL